MIFFVGIITGVFLTWIIATLIQLREMRKAERSIKHLLARDPQSWWCLQDFIIATGCDGTCLYRVLTRLMARGEVIEELRVSSVKPPVEYKLNPQHKVGLHIPGRADIHFKNSGKWDS